MKPNRFRRIRASLAALAALLVLVTHAKAADVNGDLKRNALNSQRLGRMNPYMRPKVAAVIHDLEDHGYKPLIDPGVWRSPAEQVEKVRRGYSKTLYSFHTVTTRDGKPDSLAADITDQRWGWGNGPHVRTYWLKLASAAESHRLTTGIYWGLSKGRRWRIAKAIKDKEWDANIPLGWDTAHVQPTGITVKQARAGKRPR